MTDRAEVLPSWRAGPTRDAIMTFLDDAASLPPAERVACFDNDGTNWVPVAAYVLVSCLIAAAAVMTARETYKIPLRVIDGREAPGAAAPAPARPALTGSGVS